MPRARMRDVVVGAAFELLYRSRTLYWLASTLPFAGQWRVWQRRVLPRLVGHGILDVGCGIGTLPADLVTAGYRCRAVDASPQMVAATRSELRRRGLADRDVQVVQARAQQLPFADATFDSVVSTFPTPYIHDPAALHEIARVLRPGGRLIVVEGAALLPASALLALLVTLQSLVYGQPLRRALAREPGRAQRSGVWTEEVAGRRSAIPLEIAGLRRREERDHARIWVAHIVIGEKPAFAAGGDQPSQATP
jgi:SAM-dependent methyltransferase